MRPFGVRQAGRTSTSDMNPESCFQSRDVGHLSASLKNAQEPGRVPRKPTVAAGTCAFYGFLATPRGRAGGPASGRGGGGGGGRRPAAAERLVEADDRLQAGEAH